MRHNILDVINDCFLYQHSKEATRLGNQESSILDLIAEFVNGKVKFNRSKEEYITMSHGWMENLWKYGEINILHGKDTLKVRDTKNIWIIRETNLLINSSNIGHIETCLDQDDAQSHHPKC